jgi:predicted tellurium resistance membrane protein TerC
MDGERRRWAAMIGIIIAVILGILLIGIVLKIIKIAIILALCVGAVMIAQNKFGAKRIK